MVKFAAVLGFGNWTACLKYKSLLQPRILTTGTRCSCNALFLLHINTITIWILTWIFTNKFRPFAAPSKCRPVRPAPPSLRLWQQCKKSTNIQHGYCKNIISWTVMTSWQVAIAFFLSVAKWAVALRFKCRACNLQHGILIYFWLAVYHKSPAIDDRLLDSLTLETSLLSQTRTAGHFSRFKYFLVFAYSKLSRRIVSF